jgi:anti-anti-sigma factor
MTFTDPEERLDLMAAYVHMGLISGVKVLCLTEALPPDRLKHELAQRDVPVTESLKSGQLTIGTTEEAWMTQSGGSPTAKGMLEMLAAQVTQAVGDGYPGLRVSADMLWATRPLAAIDQLLTFENSLTTLLENGQLTVICHYDRDQFDPVTLDRAVDAHPVSVAAAAYHDDALLRVCRQYSPPGIRLAGEIDAEHADALTQALTEAIRLDHNVFLNLRGLRFLDMASASTIVRAALSLPADRHLLVVCDERINAILGLAGADEAAQLRVQVAHGQP